MSKSAAVVGSGPNGLTAAITLRAAGWDVRLFEAQSVLGGGVRSESGPRPGYVRDVCSSVYALAAASPAFAAMNLGRFGLVWAKPEIPFAHPLADGSVAVPPTADDDTRPAQRWQRTVATVGDDWDRIAAQVLHGRRRPPAVGLWPFALRGLLSGRRFVATQLRDPRLGALFAGAAAHAALPLHRHLTAATGLVLAGLAHTTGWPFARGGAGRITDALVALADRLGVGFETNAHIADARALAGYDLRMLDVGPRQVPGLAKPRLPRVQARRLRGYRYGPGVCKIDYALRAPIPWRAAAARRAGTLHLGGTVDDIDAALNAVWSGRPADRPFVLVGQPSVADPTRVAGSGHAAWAYCHVPAAWPGNARWAIERQIERYAPGFGETVVDRHVVVAPRWQRTNPNIVGGDILGGVHDLRWWLRPLGRRGDAYCVRAPDLYVCSAATPPGAGVHGMCGWNAARAALRAHGLDFTLHDLRAACAAVGEANA